MQAEVLQPAALPRRKADRPDPSWCRGNCPLCGEDLVSNAYYVGGKGYIIAIECWAGLGPEEERTCEYRRCL